MIKRDDILKFTSEYLRSDEISDPSCNGLQVEGSREVDKIAFGVSASGEFLRNAAAYGADMVIVHHGLIWDKPEIIKSVFKERIEILLDNEMTLAAYHLPLDMHEKTGNNAQIISWFGAAEIKAFGKYHGHAIGFCGLLRKPLTVDQAAEILRERIGGTPFAVKFGPEKVKNIDVISGGASQMIAEAHDEGAELYISGDCSEPVYEYCRETKVRVLGLREAV